MHQPDQPPKTQRKLTPAQMRAEAANFARAYIQTQLSTEPANEPLAEAFLCQTYEAAGLDPPPHIYWLNGPLQLRALLSSDDDWASPEDRFVNLPEALWDRLKDNHEIGHSLDKNSVLSSIDEHITRSVQQGVEDSLPEDFKPRYGKNFGWFIYREVVDTVRESVRDRFGRRVWGVMGGHALRDSQLSSIRDGIWEDVWNYSRWYGIRAYDEACDLACLLFYDTYYAPNQAHALAHFSQMVSGYWLGKEVALVVRRPKLLALDARGRLHSDTSKAIAYHDGWGFYAWNGVWVSEKVIQAPEALTREDFLHEPNLEGRRLIQERMGERFVWELEGKYLDGGPRGVLYEVTLPDDPERVARYVQVQDASTDRSYFLRVPPTIQTAAEAVAWSFGLSVEDYGPAMET